MDNEPIPENKEKKPSNRNQYLSILIFGFFYSMFLNTLILRRPLTSYEVAGYLGSASFILFIGFLFTRWGNRSAGWVAVFVVSFLMFMGS